jgi:histidinol-phosphate/aromatic aminotransferase/cobyric acid decarboxylase-like protein
MTGEVLSPGPHGGDGVRLAAAIGVEPHEVLDLSMSLNPVAPDTAALVREHAGAVRAYPDLAAATGALARAMGVASDRLLLTNGGAEAIALVAGAMRRGRVDEPEFSLYRRHLEHVDPSAPRWRSNPHNPTGRLAAPAEHAAVWDEAFYPLAAGAWTRGDDAIVVGSLTKVYACPGLRLGYVLGPTTAFVDALRARQPQWSVNGLAAAVLPQLLARTDLVAWREEIATLRAALGALLSRHDLAYEPSDACYVLVPYAPGLRAHLARRAVLVRDTASFGMPHGVRIAVPDAAGLRRLTEAIEGYMP